MNWSLAHTITINLDALLSIAVCATFSRPSVRKHYPWMFSYLTVRAITAVNIEILLYGP